MSTAYDVLREPLLTVLLDDGATRTPATLCQVLAWLSGDRTLSFAALQPHQRHPWHAFLVQLGAIALEQAGQGTLPTEPEAWEELLLALTKGAREPWCLVVEALDRPALLQPPVPEKTLEALDKLKRTPDEVDILQTTRNFDVKSRKAAAAAPEHWLLALVARQTFGGYYGSGNHGIVRMNGGWGDRGCVGIAPSRRWNDRFRRDVAVCLEQRGVLVESYGYDFSGPSLLWTMPWDGEKQHSLRGLHPYFIEVCARIRIQYVEQGLLARMSTSERARVDSTGVSGDTGDIWTPIRASKKEEGFESLTVASSGFSYRRLHDILFGDWQRPAALLLRPDDGEMPTILAMGLAREPRKKGTSVGYHERRIPIPPKSRRFFARADGDERLGVRSKLQLERAGEAGRAALKPALCTLLQGTGELDFRDDRVQPWLDRLDGRIDDRFFTELFDAAPLDADAARLRWDTILVELLRQTFEEALGEVSMPSAHRYRFRAAAEGRFRAALRKIFPEATASPVTDTQEQAHA